MPRSEPLLGYAIPDSPAPTKVRNSPSAVAAPAVGAPSDGQETIAPLPRRRAAAASGPIPLTSQQIKILVGVVGGALLLMVCVMIFDGARARRMRAEAEAAAAAPLIGTAPDPLTATPSPVVAPVEPEPTVIHIVPPAKTAKARRQAVVAPTALPVGELVVNSVPEGAQVQVDGSGAGPTPIALSNISPGQHMVVLSKSGYAVESRSVLVHAGTRAALAVSLNQLAAVAAIASEPPGAAIIIDGRDTGKVTPAKLVVERGSHSLALRKVGYLETSTSLTLNPGETFQFQPALKPLGNADDIKPVGKLKKLIGRGGAENAARVQVRTFPKGAQIMFNERMMDRASPAEFLLTPGTYEVTLTLSGYKPVRQVITVEAAGRFEVNQTFEK